MLLDKNSIIIFWKITIIALGSIGLLTCIIKQSGFWSSYMLDIVGPAWIYILIRSRYNNNGTFLSFKFKPENALVLCLGICILIEIGQYLNLYPSHFDQWDFLAYASLIVPIYILDKKLQ